jgi:hypothetical protein
MRVELYHVIMIVAVRDTDVVNRIGGETKAVKNGMLSIRCATLCSVVISSNHYMALFNSQ